MNLRSTRAQSVSVAGQTFELEAGERIHVENSHKYDVAEFRELASEAGFGSSRCFTDEARLFSVWVLCCQPARRLALSLVDASGDCCAPCSDRM